MFTKFQLAKALFEGIPLHNMDTGEVVFACVLSVEREDGSCRGYNVRGYLPNLTTNPLSVTLFIRTVD